MQFGETIKTATLEALEKMDADAKPCYVTAEVLRNIYLCIDMHNAVCGGDEKWKKPRSLPAVSMALIINTRHMVRRIVQGQDRGYLAIYQTMGADAGIYVDATDGIRLERLIDAYEPDYDTKAQREVTAKLWTYAEIAELTQNPDLIAVNNGIFNYKTKKLLPFSPDYVFTSKSRVNYVLGAASPVIQNPDGTTWDVESWMQSLSDDPEIVELLWQVVGAVIRPHVRWDKMVCMYSSKGMNGKGTLCELLRQISGSTASITVSAFEDNFRLAELLSVSAVVTDENTVSEYNRDPAALKAIVTGDPVQINIKFKNPVTIRFNGLVVQCFNSMPRFSDKTSSLSRRLLIIPFDKTFKGQERTYIKSDYLHRQDVLEYILYKVLNTNYYAFLEPARCRTILDDFELQNDPVKMFLGEILSDLVWTLVPWEFLYDLYKAWMKKNAPAAKPVNKNTFQEGVRQALDARLDWEPTPYAIRATSANMGIPEPLILEYDLTAWMNPYYKGSDMVKLCSFPRKNTYRGIRKV